MNENGKEYAELLKALNDLLRNMKEVKKGMGGCERFDVSTKGGALLYELLKKYGEVDREEPSEEDSVVLRDVLGVWSEYLKVVDPACGSSAGMKEAMKEVVIERGEDIYKMWGAFQRVGSLAAVATRAVTPLNAWIGQEVSTLAMGLACIDLGIDVWGAGLSMWFKPDVYEERKWLYEGCPTGLEFEDLLIRVRVGREWVERLWGKIVLDDVVVSNTVGLLDRLHDGVMERVGTGSSYVHDGGRMGISLGISCLVCRLGESRDMFGTVEILNWCQGVGRSKRGTWLEWCKSGYSRAWWEGEGV